IGAGVVFPDKLKPFQTFRIITGAAIPDGCNAGVMLELTEDFEESEKTYMKLNRSFIAGENSTVKGEDGKQNTSLGKKGTVIN
ncbi:molybdopterin biosynthesis MoeA protein, partial [Bacillus cereus]|nr:molybdopterin biosynthesis MoeA protein [Bacillus cereus]